MSDIFHTYYNTAEDCSGEWTEIFEDHLGDPLRLESSSPVAIGIEAMGNGTVYKADSFRETIMPPTVIGIQIGQ